jgi:hypothetical protein
LVSTTVGEKAIEKLRKGDMVRAYDAPNGKNILSKIRTVGFYKDAAITRIQLSGLKDDVIETTEAHKIFVLKDGAIVSVPVSGLKVGDVLLRQSDVNASDLTDAALYAAQEGRLFAQKQSESLKLQQVSIKAITFKYRVADVFNIELEEGDSYFVNGVLVESLANYRDHILND